MRRGAPGNGRTASDLGRRLIETAQVAALSGGATSSTFIAANNVMNQFNRWSERRSQHNSGVNTQMPVFTYNEKLGTDGGFRAYAEEIGKRPDLNIGDKVKAVQAAFETMPNKTDVTIPLDAKYVLGFDDRGHVRYNWPENLGFEEKSIIAFDQTFQLPQNLDRIGALDGMNFSIVSTNRDVYTYAERAIPYAENAQAYHTMSLNTESYFVVIDAIRNGDAAVLNHILESDAGVEGLTQAEFERVTSWYKSYLDRLSRELGDISAPYGLYGNTASFMDLAGGAPQLTLPFDGVMLKRLGLLYNIN